MIGIAHDQPLLQYVIPSGIPQACILGTILFTVSIFELSKKLQGWTFPIGDYILFEDVQFVTLFKTVTFLTNLDKNGTFNPFSLSHPVPACKVAL